MNFARGEADIHEGFESNSVKNWSKITFVPIFESSISSQSTLNQNYAKGWFCAKTANFLVFERNQNSAKGWFCAETPNFLVFECRKVQNSPKKFLEKIDLFWQEIAQYSPGKTDPGIPIQS